MAGNSLCIITARGGSKRIPRKNIKPFCGKPIIAYSIQAALESGLFADVMVSTDDEEIAQVARDFGASVPFMRSAENSDDFATTKDVVEEVLARYEEAGTHFDSACCLYPTAPFVTGVKLRQAFELLDDADTVMTVVPFSFPPQRGLIQEDGCVRFWQPENATKRSQDLEPVLHDAGQFYLFKTYFLPQAATLLGPRTRGFQVSELEVQDIDNPSDWDIAEIKYKRMVSLDQ